MSLDLETIVKPICKIGMGAECCRYLTMSPTGFTCVKFVENLKTLLDDRVARNDMNARGDNCPGRSIDE